MCVCGYNLVINRECGTEQSGCRYMHCSSCAPDKAADAANELVMEEWCRDRLDRKRRGQLRRHLIDADRRAGGQTNTPAGWSIHINTSTCTVWIMAWF